MRNIRLKSQGPPLGVHIHPNGVAVVATEERKGAAAIKAHSEIPITAKGGSIKEHQKAALRKAIEELKVATTTCVLAMLPADVTTKRLNVVPKANPKQIEAFAFLEAERMLDLPADKLQIALDALPGTGDRLMSIAKREIVEDLVEIVKEAGLVPVAIDVPLAVWQRSMQDATDAILDLTYKRPALFTFAEPIGEQLLLTQGMSAAKLASDVRKAFIDQRRGGMKSDVRRVQILGEYDEMDALIEMLSEDAGLREIGPLRFGDAVNPGWAYAAAIATWTSSEGRSRKK